MEQERMIAEFPAAKAQRQTPELYLSNSGIQHCRPGHSFGPGTHEGYLLHFVLAGRGELRVAGQVYHPGRGDIFLLGPGATHYYEADANDPWHYAWVIFNGENAGTYLQYAGFSESEPVQRSQVPNETYLSIIEELVLERDETLWGELQRTSRLYQLLGKLVEAQHVPGRQGKANYEYPREIYVEHACEYIAFHYAHIKVNDIASYVGVNRSYLTMIFKEVLGESAQEYLVRYRLEQAQRLLRETPLGLRDIARRVGYEDPFAFSKMFKAKYGVSPSAWRQSAAAGGAGEG